MAEKTEPNTPPDGTPPTDEAQLDGGTYEIIRSRLTAQSKVLQDRLDQLNKARKQVFGAIETQLLTTERVTTDNNCISQDMVSVGNVLLFSYNVHLGLRTEIQLTDVFATYTYDNQSFHKIELTLLGDKRFEEDFKNLYRYYKDTRFSHFSTVGTALFMVFAVGRDTADTKSFKWLYEEDGTLTYVDNRSDHDLKQPAQHEFEWTRATRDDHRAGEHPHISIEERIFVETIGGDLTIKVEDNTDTGGGIYAEPVEDPDQTLDDAEIRYAVVGNLILLMIKPYQERRYRYIVFNEKTGQAQRIDAIEDSCILLPEDHGIIFANGYYLQTGELKQFEQGLEDMHFQRRIKSPNGEDTLFVFFNRKSGMYVLLSYNMIEQQVAPPIICHGFSIFENGELLFNRSQDEPQKHHAIQIWQTPYTGANFEIPAQGESYLYKLGNRDIVHCMAACSHVSTLVKKEEGYANIYVDIVKEASEVLDAYFWLDRDEVFDLKFPLTGIVDAAGAAIDEFEKVTELKRSTRARIDEVATDVRTILTDVKSRRYDTIDDYVELLSALRGARGTIISLKDLRYADVDEIDHLEQQVTEETGRLAARSVDFLLKDTALSPYEKRVDALGRNVDTLGKVTEATALQEAIGSCGAELELLIDTVSNLKIEDTTQRTAIVERISTVYATLNQVRSRTKAKFAQLAEAEGTAEFVSQMKLLDQAVINYLEVSDTPEKCDTYLTKMTIQLSELEGKFSQFDKFILTLAEKRDEIYTAFESRKLKLVEQRNKRSDALLKSAERILSGMTSRLDRFASVDEINGYFAADLMVEKVRDIITELRGMDDAIKADDLQTRLKTLQQDTLRQLTDRQELFVDGQNVLQFGRHKFSVNTQPLGLTIVGRPDGQYLHLTGTDFFEKITDPRIDETKPVWDQPLISENEHVYRGEYLAYMLLASQQTGGTPELQAADPAGWQPLVQQFMGPRYAEGYVKGVHDHDGALIADALSKMEQTIGLLRYSTRARALALVFWHCFADQTAKARIESKLTGVGAIKRLFQRSAEQQHYVDELRSLIDKFIEDDGLFEPFLADQAAAYLFCVLTEEKHWAISPDAAGLFQRFQGHLNRRGVGKDLLRPMEALKNAQPDAYVLVKDWVRAFARENDDEAFREYHEEVAALLLSGIFDRQRVVHATVVTELKGLVGDHPQITEGRYRLDYNDFMIRLARFEAEVVPLFVAHRELKSRIIDETTAEMRLDEFKPRILSSFVRNRLIDKVYLPLVGDNLAKQIGVVGENTRTDRMGLLLIISPPGYGKTTLMEYVANRLGLIFMKINGPAIGHQVTSLDPQEAPNAAAREEMKKLSLSFEMSDNVMIYLDDIQHLNPEFLQKFISLCDAQRKIEGVYQGRTRTYDLRGRRVCVVMAGNPYSESGEAFKIPDMLANRADTYNLGDIIGDDVAVFEMSYLENSITSSPILGQLAAKHFKDVYGIIEAAQRGSREGIDFAGNYAGAELADYISVMGKLLQVRDVILRVNQAYIYSAAQADAYRTEPPFKLQGSYRNMNRIAEKVLPIMNDKEVELLVLDHYAREAQTLTTGAEANLLKFKEMTGTLSETETERWAEIKKTFNRNQLTAGTGDDRMGQVIALLSTFGDGLRSIQDTIASSATQLSTKDHQTRQDVDHVIELLANQARLLANAQSAMESKPPSPSSPPQPPSGSPPFAKAIASPHPAPKKK